MYIDPKEFGVTEVAAELYGALAPGWIEGDEPVPGEPDHLLGFCAGVAVLLDEWWPILQANWETILDADNTPVAALGYLAQYAGVVLMADWSEDEMRAAIRSPGGFARGTPVSIVEAARRTLVGDRIVELVERYEDSAYKISVHTNSTDTPDPAVTRAAILSQKPAGILLDYNLTDTPTYAELDAAYASYFDVNTAYGRYAQILVDETL